MVVRRSVDAGVWGAVLVCVLTGSPAWAQGEASVPVGGSAQSEQVLRERLQQNVQERETLLQELEEIGRRRDEALPTCGSRGSTGV